MPFPLCLTLSLVASRRPAGFWQRPRPTCCEAAAWCPKDGLAEAAATAAGGGGRGGGSGALVPSPLCVRPAPRRSPCPWTSLCSGAGGDRLGDSALLSGDTRRWFLVLKSLAASPSPPGPGGAVPRTLGPRFSSRPRPEPHTGRASPAGAGPPPFIFCALLAAPLDHSEGGLLKNLCGVADQTGEFLSVEARARERRWLPRLATMMT